MKQVWKCDHCYHTNINKDKVEIHEDKCTFNPINKRCSTCDNQVPMDYSSDYECKIHNFGHYMNVDDGDIICKDWVNFEERSRKLKKIKNKIK